MAESEWDRAVESLRATTPAPPVKHVLWTLRKGERTAHALVCPHPHGQELRFYVGDELLWSEVFKPGRGVVLGEVAEAKRAEFEARGWKADASESRT